MAAIFISGSIVAYALSSARSATSPQNYGNQTAPIVPGPQPLFSCQFLSKSPQGVKFAGSSGFVEYKSGGVTDYVLGAGRNGVITIQIPVQTTVITTGNATNLSVSGGSNSNAYYNTTFYHKVSLEEKPVVTNVKSQGEGRARYKICYNSSLIGTSCSYNFSPSARPEIVNTTSLGHKGVYAKTIKTSGSELNLTISTDPNATSGTYWVSIAGGPCNGGLVALLTIGSGAYNGSYNSSSGTYS